ncbi:glycosyltransferase involved in cell wall biosynthesis [Hymenobacter luteus]|uniref:Glycosyltransferase involved in cell wall biosynthesis n=2 Tax=Hymenobacter TaxID=89966 RepID=A0A7W9T079_9BACT|nr:MULTISPECIES: glycosyltransferase [Hymenobacter]MBB4601339.1 glycosyltransferase involved in cell wall biosynthesis [Hymenobacter latericoloratus]MBB6058454.1 glycosyltransferase involved in cell wall biosynthesis [Hymenobacter luteus]
MAGLSVLIPVYNHDVRPLVRALLAQTAGWPGPVEVRCLDDGSEEACRRQNREVACLPGVQYRELERNVGRAAIRNQLAAEARQPWLLLLDNDSLLPDARFLARYAAARTKAPVLSGGTAYEAVPPQEEALRLRWLYGRRREARSAAVRQRAPHGQLTLNNLLIRAEVFRQLGLDESLTRYGHEDTKFGWLLRRAGAPVVHLDNPVLHNGLDPAPIFLQKTHDAVRNLVQLYRAEGLGADTKLLQAALRLQRWGLSEAVRAAFSLRREQVRRNLLSSRPSLRQLDALKLYWLLTELR